MAAPADTTWGAEVTYGTNAGKIGISREWSDHITYEKCIVKVWFWSKYSVSDPSNSFSYGVDGVTARGSVNISHSVSTGNGWSEANQTVLGTYEHEFTKSTSQVTHYLTAEFSGINALNGAKMSVKRSYTVDALPTYTITYRANNDNATGSTSNQTKTHGTDITLRTNGYSLTNHKFIGWNTVANGSGTSYAAGANYTKNEAVTLYAQWELDEYIITFDSNGGTDGPTTQSINASGGTLTVQTPKFIGYTFRGWDTSPDSVTPVYMPGDSITIDSNIILYAVWDAWNYTVTFDANGGYGDLPADINILGNDTAIIGYERPSSDGSRAFICWNTLPNGYGKSYYPGDHFCEPENGTIITLYAMYRNTDIYLNSDGTIECLEFIEDYDCQFPMIEKTGRIIAKEFIEHDGEIMIQGGIIYAKSFIEATRPFLLGKASKVYTMTDSTGAIITDNDGYILVGKFI